MPVNPPEFDALCHCGHKVGDHSWLEECMQPVCACNTLNPANDKKLTCPDCGHAEMLHKLPHGPKPDGTSVYIDYWSKVGDGCMNYDCKCNNTQSMLRKERGREILERLQKEAEERLEALLAKENNVNTKCQCGHIKGDHKVYLDRACDTAGCDCERFAVPPEPLWKTNPTCAHCLHPYLDHYVNDVKPSCGKPGQDEEERCGCDHFTEKKPAPTGPPTIYHPGDDFFPEGDELLTFDAHKYINYPMNPRRSPSTWGS